jgi:hypothetical protein
MFLLIVLKLAKLFFKLNWLVSNTPCLAFVGHGLTSVGSVGAELLSVAKERLKSNWTNVWFETRSPPLNENLFR